MAAQPLYNCPAALVALVPPLCSHFRATNQADGAQLTPPPSNKT
ncbi:hypothetical protein [Rhodococcus oryzae]